MTAPTLLFLGGLFWISAGCVMTVRQWQAEHSAHLQLQDTIKGFGDQQRETKRVLVELQGLVVRRFAAQ